MRRPSWPLLLLVSVVVTAAAVAPGVLLAGARHPPALGAAGGTAPDARAVLAAWDERRAAAWGSGDVAALGRLYAPGSAAGRHDRSMLSRWTARGLVVQDLEVVLLAVEVVGAGSARLDLRVTDRVTGGRAVGRGLDEPLPDDGPTARRVTLVRVAGEWRVAEVA